MRLSNNAMKPVMMKDHLQRIHPNKRKKITLLIFFRSLKDKYENRLNVMSFMKTPVQADNEER